MKDMLDIKLSTNALSEEKLSRLKWATTVTIIGIPILGQSLGALVLFSDKYAFISSKLTMLIFGFAAMLILLSGIYVLLNRVHLRFFGLNQGLDEWESIMVAKAQAFSYRVIFWGMFAAFIAASILGIVGLLNSINWTDISIAQSLYLNMSAMSVMIVGLFYLIFFLPTLYMAWTIKPIGNG